MANLILDKTFLFSEKILNVYFYLRSKGHLRLADQIVGSGTSIGANVEEAQAAHSKIDFISKLIIAIKKQEKQDFDSVSLTEKNY